jgi:integrase
MSPDTVLKKILRPALLRAEVTGKIIDWHSFRHGVGTNLSSLGVDIKTSQAISRHASYRTTADVYTHSAPADNREASGRQIDFLLEIEKGAEIAQHPLAPSPDFSSIVTMP